MSRYPASLRRALRELALDGNVVPPHGVYRRPAIRPAPYYMAFGTQFVWDVPYSGYALARLSGDTTLAKGFIENHLDLAIDDGPDKGMLPRSVTGAGDQAGQDGSQCPLLSWLARELHRMAPDEAFVRRAYPGLAAFVDWWQSPRRDFDGDGLSEYAGSTPTYAAYESGHDFSPERDLVMGEPAAPSADGLVHEPIADIFLNSCLYVEMDALADLAEIADPPGAAQWRERRDALAARMNEAMWDEEIGGFFPVIRRDLCPSQPRVFRHTAALFQPLWAGIASEEQARRTIRTIRGEPRDWPRNDGWLTIRIDPALYHGYQVETDALHPSRGAGAAAGGVELTAGGLTARFGTDRGPAAAAFLRMQLSVRVSDVAEVAKVHARLHDGSERVHQMDLREAGDGTFAADVPGDWVPGIRELAVEADGCRLAEVKLGYSRFDRAGLLSPFGIKSAHPLDGKHPAPGAPTEYWSGTIWGPHQLHGVQALARYGEPELAAACARAFCDTVALAYAAGGDAYEHNSHENGHGLGTGRYTWGAAVALVLMEDYADRD